MAKYINKYTLRLTDEQNNYLKLQSKEAGISELTYIRLLIANDMRGDKNCCFIPQR